MKKLLRFAPELYFIGLGVFWAIENYFASGYKNYIALLLVWLMFIQILYQNRIMGLIYGNLTAMLSGYMLMATLSEFREYETLCADSLLLLIFGFGIFLPGLAMGAAMIYKSLKAKQKYDENVLTVTY
jgi:hypothetical protein